mmetsp:Transcript_137512/g.383522  ORF Transcript_137512/g.383522 Transcript_137512/m.383522 type:complete len:85 (-) Transcript_137512:694-948(-)
MPWRHGTLELRCRAEGEGEEGEERAEAPTTPGRSRRCCTTGGLFQPPAGLRGRTAGSETLRPLPRPLSTTPPALCGVLGPTDGR